MTGDPGSQRPETTLYRFTVTSSDGERAGITVGVTHHRKVPAKANLHDIADALRIDRKDLPMVLKSWSHDELVKWLEKFTGEQLLPPAMRRQRGIS